jgi:hypothetical protein
VPIPVPPDVSEEEVQEAADAAAEALPEDTEAVVGERDPEPEPSPEPDDMQRTIEQLRSTGDPNEVERTPVLESGNIEVAPDEWELGFPLQGIPRLAAVLNLNYVYNEERDRWERQEPFRDTATGAPVAKLGGVSSTSVGSTAQITVTFSTTVIEDGMTVTGSQDGITLPADGAYHVEANLLLDNYQDDAKVELDAAIFFGDTIRSVENLSLDQDGFDETTVGVSGVVQGSEGDTLQLEFFNSSNQSMTVEGGTFESYLAVTQL